VLNALSPYRCWCPGRSLTTSSVAFWQPTAEESPLPTTVTGLLLFIALMLPGLAFVTVRERLGIEHRKSVLRETGAVVFCSVITELMVLGLFAAIRTLWPKHTPDVGRLVREGANYAQAHYAAIASWSVGLLAVAVLVAASSAKWLATRPHHASTMSAWYLLFEGYEQAVTSQVFVGCVLDDGSFIQGRLASFNTRSDDVEDRDVVLVPPLLYRPPGDSETQDYSASAACISARRMVTMFVSYPPDEAAAAPQGEGSGVA